MEFSSEHGHGAENQTLIPGYQSGTEFHRKTYKVICFRSLGYACQTLMKGQKVKGSTEENLPFSEIISVDLLHIMQVFNETAKANISIRLTEERI